MPEFISFFIVIGIGILFSEVFFRLRLPYVTALMLAGFLFGPPVLGLVPPSQALEFIAQIGLVFVMFMAGLHMDIPSLKKYEKGIGTLAALTGLFPLLVGIGLGHFLMMGWLGSLVLGVVFVSASIEVVVPSIEGLGLLKKRVGKVLISATIVEDMAAMLLLAIVLHQSSPLREISVWLYVPALIIVFALLKVTVPKLSGLFFRRFGHLSRFEREIRFTLATLLAVVVLFEVIGIHAIVAGFIAGVLLAPIAKEQKLLDKLHVIAYGIFIPVFFFMLGARVDLHAFVNARHAFQFVFIIAMAAILSKALGGFVAGKMLKLTSREAGLIAASSIPKVSTALVATFLAYEAGIFFGEMMAAIVALSVVSALLAPLLIQLVWKEFKKEHLIKHK